MIDALLPAREVSLVLRLSATFRGEQAVTSDLPVPGALTVLAGMAPNEAEAPAKLVSTAQG